jgi:hypothetical protein
MEELTELTEAELRAWDEFSLSYDQRNPPPSHTRYSTLAALGWEFWAMVIVAIATMLLTALRTGSWFYLASVKIETLPPAVREFLASAEALLAVIAYEGFLLLSGILDGKKRIMNPVFRGAAVLLVLSTSVAAGLGVSLNVMPETQNWATKLLAALSVLMGLASLLAFFSGELLGNFYAEAQQRIQDWNKAYETEHKKWYENKKQTWPNWRKRFLLRQGVVDDSAPRAMQTQAIPVPSGNLTEAVRKYLSDNNINPSEASGAEVARALGAQPDTVRVIISRIRKE